MSLRDWGSAVVRGRTFERLQRAGLAHLLLNARSKVTLESRRWIRSGCPSPAPAMVKAEIVRGHVRTSGARVFIETGTYLGTTVQHVARLGVECHTIEIDEALHRRATRALARHTNIDVILGNSAEELPRLLKELAEPAVFWLDGHFSGGVTGRGDLYSPIRTELMAILDHRVKRHVVLIDDARLFDGTDDYPRLAELLGELDGEPDYQALVSTDMVRILPKN